MTNEEIISQLQQEVQRLSQIVESMRSQGTFPNDILESIKNRMGFSLVITGIDTSPSATSVNEAGAGSYQVARLPDGNASALIDGAVRKIPYYN